MATTIADLLVHFDTSGVEGVTGGIGLIQRGFGGLPGVVGVAGAAIVASAGAAAIASVKMAGDFQESMTQLVTGAGESKSNLQLVSNGILQMATETGTSTQQLSAGMYMIESAGFHGADGLKILQAAAEGAKVGNADLGTVADATTTVLKDYPNTMNGAAGAVNALTATVAQGKTHMQDLAGSLSQVAPTASAAGVSLYDMLGAMATMTGEGVPAANAATYLRQTIIALEAPSSAGAKALKSIGLSAQDVQDSIKNQGLPATLDMITTKVGKEFPVGSAAYLNAIKDIAGGSKSMQGILDLTGSHMKDFADATNAVGGAAVANGNKIQGWSEVQGDFNQQMSRLGEVVETAGIQLGTKLLPYVTQAATWVADHLGPALSTVSGLFDHVASIVGNVATILLGRLQPGIQAVQGAFSGLGKGMGTINWDQISGAVGNVAAAVGVALNDAITTIVPLIQKLAPQIESLAAGFGTDLANAIKVVTPIVEQVATWFLTKMLPALIQVAGFIETKVIPVIIQIVGWFGAHVLPIIEQVANIFMTDVLPALEQVWNSIATNLIPALEHLWNELSPIIIPVLQVLGDILKNVVGPALSGIIGLVGDLINGLSNLLGWLGNVKDKIGGVFSGIGGLLGKIPGFAAGVQNFSGGLALVGEQGPELAMLPPGTSILTAQQTAGLIGPVPTAGASSGGGGQTGYTVVNMNLDGRTVARIMVPHLPRVFSIASGDRSH